MALSLGFVGMGLSVAQHYRSPSALTRTGQRMASNAVRDTKTQVVSFYDGRAVRWAKARRAIGFTSSSPQQFY